MKHVENRIVIKVDHNYKKSHKFADGTVLALERGWNNLDKRETAEVNGIVISAEDIPQGAEILIHHNATHDTNKILDHGQLSGLKIASHIEYYSIPETQAFFWRKDSETWHPVKGYVTGIQVYKPYRGILQGIDPTIIKDTLYITSGDLKGQVCHTVRAANYEMIFQDLDGRENRLIRCRHWDDEDNEREELTAISHYLTQKVNSGEYIIGLTPTTAKSLKETYAKS